MAAAWFNHLVAPERARALSAGTEPGERVHPEVVAVMREAGLELAEAQPQLLTNNLAAGCSLLVTMGCGETCPVVPGVEREDWPLADPKGQPREEVRAIRDAIRGRIETLLNRNGWQRPPGTT
jgi:arsenate reductase